MISSLLNKPSSLNLSSEGRCCSPLSIFVASLGLSPASPWTQTYSGCGLPTNSLLTREPTLQSISLQFKSKESMTGSDG